MTDAKGRELKVGDTVKLVLSCQVVALYDDTRCVIRPLPNTIGEGLFDYLGFNSSDLIRANPGDSTDFEVVRDGDKTIIK